MLLMRIRTRSRAGRFPLPIATKHFTNAGFDHLAGQPMAFAVPMPVTKLRILKAVEIDPVRVGVALKRLGQA